uniref:Putative secreted protein n=1 Tax=Anopheles darlingi TaxID=43151 RepID=A0A2M4DL18_ANODA
MSCCMCVCVLYLCLAVVCEVRVTYVRDVASKRVGRGYRETYTVNGPHEGPWPQLGHGSHIGRRGPRILGRRSDEKVRSREEITSHVWFCGR